MYNIKPHHIGWSFWPPALLKACYINISRTRGHDRTAEPLDCLLVELILSGLTYIIGWKGN